MAGIKNRNHALDAFKAIAALGVVFIHYNHVGGDAGKFYTGLMLNITTFCVPFFFMITGFFLIPVIEKKRAKAYIKKILILALCSSAFYFAFYLLDATDRLGWLREHYTIGKAFTWLTGQDDPAGFHLWYLYCLIWTFTLVAIIYKYTNMAVLYLLTLVVIAYHFSDIGMFRCYTISIPAVVTGMLLYRNKDKVSKMPYKTVIMCAVGMFLFMGIETYYGFTEPGYYYEGHILALIFFVLALSMTAIFKSGRLAYIGLEFSALIYILHVFANNILSRFVDYDTIPLQFLRPWMVFGLSLGMSMICVYVSRLKISYATCKDRA